MMGRQQRRVIALIAPLAVLASSAGLARDIRPNPSAAVPPDWPAGPAYLPQDEAAFAQVEFGQIFTDPRLQALVAQALVNNRDLRVAAANVLAARARVDVQRGAQLPGIDAGVNVTRRSTGPGGGAATGVQTAFGASAGISSFELDLFGRLAAATRAERETALAVEANARAVRLALVADLARAWAAHAADAELLAIAEATAVNARRGVALSQARLAGGVAARSELRQAEELLATAEADLARQQTALAQDRNLVALLVGAPVDQTLLPTALGPLIAAIHPLAPGASSAVLLRRPDMVAAEYHLRAANADVAAARAALFPRITLGALVGLAGNTLSGLFGGSALTSTLGGGAGYSLFAGGSARAGVRVSEAERTAAVATYERTIQAAFRDVADVLARQGTIGDELAANRRRAEATADSARLVEARYRGGVASSLEHLDAQRSAYAAERQVVGVTLTYVVNRVDLYQSLGGGMDTAQPIQGAGSN